MKVVKNIFFGIITVISALFIAAYIFGGIKVNTVKNVGPLKVHETTNAIEYVNSTEHDGKPEGITFGDYTLTF